MKTTLGLVFVLLSITALAQDKNVSPKNEEIKIDFSQPLFIVDGLPASQAEVNLINPDKIASMRVMKKKEATMLFGDAARNGAIIITTKETQKPKSGK